MSAPIPDPIPTPPPAPIPTEAPAPAPAPAAPLLTPWSWVIAVLLVAAGAGIHYLVMDRSYRHPEVDRLVGPSTCIKCHAKQGDSWTSTRMSKAFDLLRPGVRAEEKKKAGLEPDADYTKDENCLDCHTTGRGLVGGFVSFEKTPEMAGVTCEACHGAGGAYAGTAMNPKTPNFTTQEVREKGLVYPPTARVCAKCHNEDSPFIGKDYKFAYDERVKLGTHRHFPLEHDHGR